MGYDMMTEKAYAKINLYLDVLGKREDGYHNILNVMTEVKSDSFYDTVTVSKAEGRSMTCTDPTLTVGEDNLCLKAAKAFFDALGSGDGCFIELDKHLPREAGLGGGSSDAAAVLRALNRLYDGVFTTEELCKIGAKIGADVPFCVKGGTVFATGTGEQMTELPPLTDGVFMIVKPQGGVSTPEAYRLVDAKADLLHPSASAFCEALKRGDTAAMMAAVGNSSEDALRLPSCLAAKEQLLRHGAGAACMSGSGSAVFGWFTDRARAEACADTMQHGDVQVRVCVPCRGVVLE